MLFTLGIAPDPTATVNAMLLVALAANGPLWAQVTIWPETEQLHPVPVADTKLNPVGRLSVTVIVPVVGLEPAFLTAIV